MNRNEKKYFWRLAIIVVLLTSFPYVFGFLVAGKNKHFAGYIENPRDTLSYYMWMRQVFEGEYLLENMFATEPQPRVYFNPFFFVMGIISRGFKVSPHLMYWILRIPISIIFLYVVYRFLACFFYDPWKRKWCFALICFSSGFGWIFVIPRVLAGNFDPIHFPVDLFSPSAITFWMVLSMPHVTFSQAIMFLYFMLLFKFRKTGDMGWVWAAGFLAGFAAVNHTYDIVIIGTTTFLYFVFLLIFSHNIGTGKILAAVSIVLALTTVAMLYVFYVVRVNKTLGYWSQQVFSPYIEPVSYLLGAGILLPFAVVGVLQMIWRKKTELLLPGLWFLVLPFLLYGFFFQPAKLVNGSHVILCILAISTLTSVKFIKELDTRGKKWIIVLSVLITFPSNLVVIGNNFFNHLLYPEPLPSLERFYFLEKDVWEGFQWLDKNTNNQDTVMCSRNIGWLIPGFTGNRTISGHRDFTMKLNEKLYDSYRYYKFASFKERMNIINKYNVHYVWVGPDENVLVNQPFQPDSILEPVFSKNRVTIFKVSR